MPTHSEALLEAYASCPPSARIYQTLEVWHPSFAQAARVVANVGDDMTFGIEAGAPRDGGSIVTFIACPFRADYPEQREGQPPSCKIWIDNVARELVPQIRARARRAGLYRRALSRISRQRSAEPAYGPVQFELTSVQMTGTTLTGTVVVKNLQNKRFPRITKNYTYQQFPSLLP